MEVLAIYFAMKQEQTFLILFRIAILPDGSLRILNASKSDEGKYICQGENIFGSAEIIASLSVKGKITGNMPDVPQSCLPSLGIRGRKLNAIACTCVCIDWCECLGLNFFKKHRTNTTKFSLSSLKELKQSKEWWLTPATPAFGPTLLSYKNLVE